MKYNVKKYKLRYLLLINMLAITTSSLALEIDREKPVHISADKVTIDEKTGISNYMGNVSIEQGSMKLTGDKVTVYQPDGKLDKIIVNGSPAKFKQLSDQNNQEITATAKVLNYHTINEKLILTGEARLTQGPNSFSGHIIEYDTRNSTVTANTDDDKKQRVNAVITPKSIEKN
ncbi:MAG: lipopolysaccharide transport periplasmic protein LptA [Gammaproteobacteria bacterium]